MRSKWFVLLPALASLALSACDRDPTRTTPEPVEPVFGVLGAGGSGMCALDASGAAYCWGSNGSGALGVGDLAPRSGPVPVAGGLLFQQLDRSGATTCALDADGQAYCWGSGTSGALGSPAPEECGSVAGVPFRCAPAPVPVSGGLRFASVTVGSGFGCGVTADGAGFCWGRNVEGELGNGTLESSEEPTPVAGGFRFQQISAGSFKACGVTLDGAGYCWGRHAGGQLGTGEAGSGTLPVPTPVSGGLRFSRIEAGEGSITCGITSDRAAYCWGYAWMGVGDGTRETRAAPVRVAVDAPVVAAAVGFSHACVLTETGAMHCWGSNASGLLGEPAGEGRPTPGRAAPGLRFRSVAASHANTCGVTTGGDAFCWGEGSQGQLGGTTMGNTHAPVLVFGGIAGE